jgi:uncharacterized protein (TIGR03083 family)
MRRLGRTYEDTRGRIIELVRDLKGAAAATVVPACSEWSVHDLIAHLTGICSDILDGNVSGSATSGWTAAQVDKRRDVELEDILTEWDEAGSKIAAMLDDLPGWYGRQMVADLTVHEHDLRGALDKAGERHSEGVAIGTDFLVSVMLNCALSFHGLGPLEVRAGEGSWVIGTGDPPTDDPEAWRIAVGTMEPQPTPPAPAVGTLRSEPFELLRAISGRRSAAQIRGLDWTVDPEPHLVVFNYGPFTIRDTDLIE